MIGKKHFDSLKILETELRIEFWKAVKVVNSNVSPTSIIDEMKEALEHISKAIDILEWDEE